MLNSPRGYMILVKSLAIDSILYSPRSHHFKGLIYRYDKLVEVDSMNNSSLSLF